MSKVRFHDVGELRQRNRFSGRVLSVRDELAGSTLVDAVGAGDTQLEVEDATYFEEEGGTLEISDDTAAETALYTEVDLDEDTITLATGLANSYTSDAKVVLYPYVSMRFAEVAVIGGEDNTVRAVVPAEIALVLPLGTREDTEQERVQILHDAETLSWIVAHVWTASTVEDSLVQQSGVRVIRYELDDPCEVPYCSAVQTGLSAALLSVRGTFGGAATSPIIVNLELNGEVLQALQFDAGVQDTETFPLDVFIASTDTLRFCFTDNADAQLPFNGYITADFG